MIVPKLEQLVAQERQKGSLASYVRNLLKEYLQVHLLSFIYTTPAYRKACIFTGGTCLRHYFGLPRFSEDLDFDLHASLDREACVQDLLEHFRVKYLYADLRISLKQQGAQLLLKFPVLHRLRLAASHESDHLYVTIDLSANPSTHFVVEAHPTSLYGLNFVAYHYDLPSLMAGKLHAVLTRRHLTGQTNRQSIKGRDYFDLLWYLQREVRPNLQRLKEMLGTSRLSLKILKQRIDAKVDELCTTYRSDFVADLAPLIGDTAFLKTYIHEYRSMYEQCKWPT